MNLGAPKEDFYRSEAAYRVYELAKQNDLFLYQYEYRKTFPLAEKWHCKAYSEEQDIVEWRNARLIESKYSSFKNDLMIGSFNPVHRGKWSSHEICHNLVGFAWNKDKDLLWHALAARISESLPVALWYFYDEATLTRCKFHQDGMALFQDYCHDCESIEFHKKMWSKQGERKEKFVQLGNDFLREELNSIKKSILHKTPFSHQFAGLDLMTDALQYARNQLLRLQSTEYQKYIEAFFPKSSGRSKSLEELMDRVEAVQHAILFEDKLEKWHHTKLHRICQDLAWRMIELKVQCESEEIQKELDSIVYEKLVHADWANIKSAIAQYTELDNEWELIEPEDMFAVGYDLGDGYGYAYYQIQEGIAQSCPNTWNLLLEGGEEKCLSIVEHFVNKDQEQRKAIGLRFAEFLSEYFPGRTSELANIEANLVLAPKAVSRNLYFEEYVGSEFKLAQDVAVVFCHKSSLEALDIFFPELEEDSGFLILRKDEKNEVRLCFIAESKKEIVIKMQNQFVDFKQCNLSLQNINELKSGQFLEGKKWA